MIKAAIFDMDGVLIDSEPLWHKVQETIYGEFGLTFTRKQHAALTGMRTEEVVEHMYKLKPWKGPSVQAVAERIQDEVMTLVRQEGALLPGVHQAIQVCKKAGLPVAIASSAAVRMIDTVVDTLEIREHFDHIYSAQYEEYAKPHPGVFLQVAKHFKVAPQECLVFEDSPSGVLAAKAARMICVAVPNEHGREHQFVATADAVLGSLEEFDEVMLRRLGQA